MRRETVEERQRRVFVALVRNLPRKSALGAWTREHYEAVDDAILSALQGVEGSATPAIVGFTPDPVDYDYRNTTRTLETFEVDGKRWRKVGIFDAERAPFQIQRYLTWTEEDPREVQRRIAADRERWRVEAEERKTQQALLDSVSVEEARAHRHDWFGLIRDDDFRQVVAEKEAMADARRRDAQHKRWKDALEGKTLLFYFRKKGDVPWNQVSGREPPPPFEAFPSYYLHNVIVDWNGTIKGKSVTADEALTAAEGQDPHRRVVVVDRLDAPPVADANYATPGGEYWWAEDGVFHADGTPVRKGSKEARALPRADGGWIPWNQLYGMDWKTGERIPIPRPQVDVGVLKSSERTKLQGINDAPVDTWTPGQINKALDWLDELSRRVTTEMIARGRGHEYASDIEGKTDMLSRERQALWAVSSKIHREMEWRYGPKVPSRLPKDAKARRKVT